MRRDGYAQRRRERRGEPIAGAHERRSAGDGLGCRGIRIFMVLEKKNPELTENSRTPVRSPPVRPPPTE